MHWTGIFGIVFVILTVTVLPAVLFSTVLAPTANQEDFNGPPPMNVSGGQARSKALCPNNGKPLNVPQGNCKGQSSSNVKPKFLSNETNLACEHLTQWSLTKMAQPSVTMGSNQSLTNVPMFSITAQPSSAGSVFKANFQLSLDNDKKCEAKLASMLVLLQKTTNTGTDNGYGKDGNQKHVWAIAGSENAATAGKCNSPGLTPICSNSNNCNITVPYISNSIWVRNSLVNLTDLTLPPLLKTPLVLDMTVLFQISDVNATLIQANPNNFTIDVLISYDSCCNMTSTCAIDIDCDGTEDFLATSQASLPLAPVSNICADNERCTQVTIKDIPQPLASSNSNTQCLITGAATNPFPASGTVLTSGLSTTVYGSLLCDTLANCACSGSGVASNSISNLVTLSGTPDCVDPITNLSLINPAAAAIFSSTCAYPSPVNCVVSDWTAWSVDTPCGVNNNPRCTVRSKRTRMITTPSCHGGTACPVLSETKDEPCSDSCFYMAPECNNLFTCNNVDVCNTTKECNTYPNTPMHCVAGVSQPCPIQHSTESTACSSICTYDMAVCDRSDCDLNSCAITTDCAAHPFEPSHCQQGQSLECPVAHSTSAESCSTDCTYTGTAECFTSGCDPNVCSTRTQCDTVPDAPTQCLNGVSATCPIFTQVTNTACATSCSYTEWNAWSAFGVCSPVDSQNPSSLCSQSQTRTRSLLHACPNTTENRASCVDKFETNTIICSCSNGGPTPVPSPSPSPPSPSHQCAISQDCPTPPNKCSEAVCHDGSCYIQSKSCPDLDKCNPSGCDPDTGFCVHTTTVCNDDNSCTSDTCSLETGQCVSTNITTPVTHKCMVYSCDPSTGGTLVSPLACPAGSYCISGDPESLCRPNCQTNLDCTFLNDPNDKCLIGVCGGHGQCEPSVKFCFNNGVCDPRNGDCTTSYPCEGALLCGQDQLRNYTTCSCYDDPAKCVNGPCSTAVYNTTTKTCTKTTITTCPSDNNVCTTDPQTCDFVFGCAPSRYQPISCPIQPCKNSFCDPISGCQTSPVICPSDNNPLTADECDPFTGACTYSDICDDKNSCTLDSYNNGTCYNVRNATCCHNNTECTSNQCTKTNPLDVTGYCEPPLNLGGCNEGTSCLPDDICAITLGTCINGQCVNYGTCRNTVATTCDSLVCTDSGCAQVESDSFCKIGPLTSNFCSVAHCSNSAKHCAQCPLDQATGQTMGGLFDIGCLCY